MADEWPPRWWGKKFHNELIRKPKSEQRRIVQILTEKTKRTALKQCMVPGLHKGKIVEAHDIQRAVMRKLASHSNVMAFAQMPMVEHMEFPDEVPISHAMTGYFTCEEHEKLFSPVEKQIPDFENDHHLLLLAYKALIRAMWEMKVQRAMFEAHEQADPKSDFPNYMARLCRGKESGIGYYKHLVEVMLGIADHPSPYDDEPDVIKHFIIRVPSKCPSIAASCWSDGLRWWWELVPNGAVIEKIGQWGCTVYPMEEEHVVVYHYPSADESIILKGTWQVRQAIGTVLQRRFSRDLLGRMEGIVMSSEVWRSFTDEKRSAIRDFFWATMPRMDIEIPDAPRVTPVDEWHSKRLRLVNLFEVD